MDKASVFGTEDCRFESYRGHKFSYRVRVRTFFLSARAIIYLSEPKVVLFAFLLSGHA